ncbi:MAG: hypothetical protein M3Q07_26790, partial [Pseudobdellovibrionaceae bacterium]|nr:hypothetical protein [Pseudobdellovibrionaceae bacterium]
MQYVFFSAAWMGGYAGLGVADESAVLPLSDRGSQSYPLIERQADLDKAHVVLLAGATRLQSQYTMTPGSRIRLLQREREELRFQWPGGTEKALTFAERSGPLLVAIDDPGITSGIARFPATDKNRWIEITAAQAAHFQAHSIRYEEAQPRPEDHFRPLALSGGIESVVTRQDGSEERFFQIKNGSTLTLHGPTLLKIQTRGLLASVKAGHRPVCLIQKQQDEDPGQFWQAASAASPFEFAELKGQKLGVGYPATFYLTAQKPMVLKIATDCLIQVQALATDEQTPFINRQDDKALFAAFEHAETRPLETYRQLLDLPRCTAGYRVLQGLRSRIEREDLYFKPIYPRELREGESVALVRGLPRNAMPDADSSREAGLIPADLQTDCFCVKSSEKRKVLVYSNPREGQATLGRLMIPTQAVAQDISFAIELRDRKGKALKKLTASLNEHPQDPSSLFSSFTFPIPADTAAVALVRLSRNGTLPRLGLEVLTEREKRLDQAMVLNQISTPRKGFMETMITGTSKTLPPELQRRLMPARDTLQR